MVTGLQSDSICIIMIFFFLHAAVQNCSSSDICWSNADNVKLCFYFIFMEAGAPVRLWNREVIANLKQPQSFLADRS